MATDLAVPSQPDLMQLALESRASIDVIERIAALKEHMLEREAEAEFNSAMHRCQEKMKRVGTDAANPQTHSRYATYSKLDAALRPIYTTEHFCLSFNTEPIEKQDTQRVICYVSHRNPGAPFSHTRKYLIDMPADGKGAKGNDVMTKTHATGSAASYGMRYLLKMIFNVAVGETDDDGNGGQAGIPEGNGMDEQTFAVWLEKIEAATNVKELQDAFFAASKRAKESGDRNALHSFEKAKNETWRRNGGFK
jgi:ERF superfamily